MRFSTPSIDARDVGTWMVRAKRALRAADFVQTYSILREAAAAGNEPCPQFWMLQGTCSEFQGKLPEAISSFESALNAARLTSSLPSHWRACFALSRVYRRHHQAVPARQYLSWGMTTYFQDSIDQPSDESRLELLLSTTGQGLPELESLQKIHHECSSPEVQGEIEWLIAQQLGGEAGLPWLFAACNNFMQAGNCYASMICREQAAKVLLRVQRWQEGIHSLRIANIQAEKLGLSTHIAHYSKWTGRLKRALVTLSQNAAVN